MLLPHLQRFLTTPVETHRDIRVTFWLCLSIGFALIYSLMGLQEAFSSPWVIHDDVRSHVFWMWRFIDPQLFPNDLIADYFQSVAPWGYTQLYKGGIALGFDPITFNKLLPLPLVLITTGYCFWISMMIFPVPASGFIATLLLNQTIWNTHDIPSATPRAFIYPLLFGFLYYVMGRSLLPCLITIVLQGLFYPQTLFLSSGILILRLVQVHHGRLRLSPDRRDYLFCGLGLALVFVLLLPYALKISDYGPALTAAEGRTLSTLAGDGRKNFFFDDPLKFWFCGERSGMFPYNWCKFERPPQLWGAIALPMLLLFPKRFPLASKISDQSVILIHLLLSSLGMFFLAHLLLFRLHLPSRYTKHSIRMVVAIAAGMALILLLEAGLRWAAQRSSNAFGGKILPTVGCVGLLSIIIFGYPALMDRYPNPDYVHSPTPEVYEFLAQQPADSLVASLSELANNIPSLAQRSILTASEIANPYHVGYYGQIQQRTEELMAAQYSLQRREVRQFIDTYGVDFWLVDVNAFQPTYILKNSWLRELGTPAVNAIQILESDQQPVIERMMRRCDVFRKGGRILLDAQCILENVSSGRSQSAQ
ncbi:MAG: hypothetical protein AAGA75_02750 [Cyanobacteria bacterium P01_E01_bin.6]